ncbi:MAG: LysR family transcriptional regulator [Neisseria sp.]|nr:LysR family transcriptional regulator [Neisseria sp.]
MDTLFSLKVFRQVVESGSFTRAAEQLGISTAMASKHVSHLENSIRAKLLHRNSRNLHLTEAGEAYYRESSYALDTLQTAAERAAQGTDKPQGELKITAPLWFANSVFASWMSEYCQKYPDIQLHISLNNKRSNLIADGYDLALRVSNDPAPSLIVKPLCKIHFYLVATPEYLQRHGEITSPEHISQHSTVLPSYVDLKQIELRSADGKTYPLELNSQISSDNTVMLQQLVLASAGLGYLPAWLVQSDIAAGRLQHLLPEYTGLVSTLYAAYVDRAFLSAKVRSLIDFLQEKVAEHR